MAAVEESDRERMARLLDAMIRLYREVQHDCAYLRSEMIRLQWSMASHTQTLHERQLGVKQAVEEYLRSVDAPVRCATIARTLGIQRESVATALVRLRKDGTVLHLVSPGPTKRHSAAWMYRKETKHAS